MAYIDQMIGQRPTPEQAQAIMSQGHHILVSASAGSGKTWVMGHRVVKKIIDDQLDITQLFIATFTNKSGEELRQRISRFLKQHLQYTRDIESQKRLNKAIQQLPQADIGTIDAFNGRLLKQYYHLVNIDPNYRLLSDTAMIDLLNNSVLDQLIDQEMSRNPVNFEHLVNNFASDRKIDGFKDVVNQVLRFAESTPNPRSWLEEESLAGIQEFKQVSDLPDDLFDDIESAIHALFRLIQDSLDQGIISSPAQVSLAEDYLAHRDLWLQYTKDKDYQGLYQAILSQKLPTSAGGSKSDEALQENKKAYTATKNQLLGTKSKPGQLLKSLNKLTKLELIASYSAPISACTIALRDFVLVYYQALMAQKTRDNVLTFSDVSHLVIQLLDQHESVRNELQAQFAEIMIDEYQDTNDIQEAIITRLSRGDNLFMVGDMKQSIYGFRLANPALFQDKYQAYQSETSPHELIRLKENFRSSGEVLSFTNQLFAPLMDQKLGEMVYDEEAKLIVKHPDYLSTPHPELRPHYLLYQAAEVSTDEHEKGTPKLANAKIHMLAKAIQDLIKTGVKPSEIAILVRTKGKNNAIEDVLTKYHIPVVLDEGRVDYLKSMEVMVMLDVLRSIDNPFYDLSLVSLLRSPLVGFNEDELARISLQATDAHRFFEKLQMAQAGTGQKTDLISSGFKAKINDFMRLFEKWQQLKQTHSLSDLIWQIYLDTYYVEYVAAMRDGRQRQANLEALTTRAQQFERQGYKGLYQFIKLLDNLLEQTNDLASVRTQMSLDAVRVMTIHKSKGLEFPYVFVMDMDRRPKQFSSKVLMTRQYGIGIRYIADVKDKIDTAFPHARLEMDSLPYQVNQELIKQAEISEEMRLLYVACTRAIKQLYFVGEAPQKLDTFYNDVKLNDSGILSDKDRMNQNGLYQNWVLALGHLGLVDFDLHLVSDSDLEPKTQAQQVFPPSFEQLIASADRLDLPVDYEALKVANQILDYRYPYQEATKLASIQTPSQIKQRYLPLIDHDATKVIDEDRVNTFELLQFDTKTVTGAEVGSATHELMQKIDLTQVSLASIRSTIAQLKVRDAVKKRLSPKRILAFFETSLGLELQMNHDLVVREAPFSMLQKDAIADDYCIVRGIVDGFIRYPDRLVLFDYKTDYCPGPDAIPAIKKRYQGQMALYAKALSLAYHITQVDQYLILLGNKDKVFVEKYQ